MTVNVGMYNFLEGYRGCIVGECHILAISMYWPYQNFSVCEICALKIQSASQKMLDPIGWRSLFESHVLTYGMVFVAREVSEFLYSLCMYGLKWHIEPPCSMVVGNIVGQNGVSVLLGKG